jgi:signal transduction histidine kinase
VSRWQQLRRAPSWRRRRALRPYGGAGELTARLAQDLRNPLSGVLMVLTNMRGEIDSAEQTERLTTGNTFT